MTAMLKLSGILLLWMVAAPWATAFELSQNETNNPLKIESVSITAPTVGPGDRVAVTVDVKIDDGFYVYDDKVELFPLEPDGLQVGGLQMNPAVDFVDFSGKRHTGLKNQARFQFFAEIPQSLEMPLKKLVMDIEYVACTQKVCLPKARREVVVPVNLSSSGLSQSSLIEQQIDQNIWWAFILVFVFGFLTSLTPCVYPLIPITLAVIGARTSQASRSTAFFLSLVYVLGIAATYSLLGVAAARTGALFGQALSYQPVVLFFVALFLLMALSIYGYFELQVPHFITRSFQKAGPRRGFLGAFSSGLVAGVVASPCVGPVLVGVLAYIAKSQNMILGFGLLFTFAMGMGVLFLFLGTFSSAFQKLPRSGGWMDLIKFVLGTALLAVALWYLRPLLSPEWFAICCALLLFAASLIFLTKVFPKIDSKWLHRAPLMFCALTVVSPLVSQWKPDSQTSSSKVALKNGWRYFSEEALEVAQSEGRPVIIDFFADWCVACVELDEKTFSTKQFIEATQDVVLLKVDASENSTELVELQKKYEVYGLPTIIFINKKGEFQKELTLTGFEEIEPFLVRLQRIKN